MSSTIAKHAKKHGIVPLKKYSQNFIFDSSLCDKIVRVSGIKPQDAVLEIGPGIAGLTKSILKYSPSSLTVVEIDARCMPLLEELSLHSSKLKIIRADALQFNISRLKLSSKINIVANLPYQIATELLIRWLWQAELISSMTLMLQKEVVDRITAAVATKAYGRLSVICQLICEVKKCFTVRPQAFYPPPKVHSTIVKLIPTSALEPAIFTKVELITKLAFGQRRKMLKSSLFSISPHIENILQELGILSTQRAENLSPIDYLNIAYLI